VSSSRYDPLLPTLHKKFVQILICAFIRIRCIYTCICIYAERREREQQWPKETKDEGRDLIPCGKREEIFACVCKA
jgi:hypothetical protein